MDPLTIGMIVGALAGAGKTATNKDQRKKPMSWISNVVGGAAAGAAGGAGAGGPWMAALQGAKGGFMGGDMGRDGNPFMIPPFVPTGEISGQIDDFGLPPIQHNMDGLQDGELDLDDPSLPKKANSPVFTTGTSKRAPEPGTGGADALASILGNLGKLAGNKGGNASSAAIAAMMPGMPNLPGLYYNPMMIQPPDQLQVQDPMPLYQPGGRYV